MEEVMKALNSSASHDYILGPKLKSSRVTVLVRKRCKLCLESILKKHAPKFYKLENDSKEALARYITKYATEKVPEKTFFGWQRI